MMVHDYFQYFGDLDFVRQMLPGVQAVLDWFGRRRLDSGIIGHCEFWNFWDWVDGWDQGNPAREGKDPITLTSLVYADTCRLAGDLYQAVGESTKADSCASRRRTTIRAVNRECYDKERKLYLDLPGKPHISQHTNAWAIITGAVLDEEAAALADQIIETPDLRQTTLYFTFYLFRAWEAAGTYQHFWRALEKWSSLLKYNFTTFPEHPSPDTRSDCHAWSSSPMYELVTCVLGIRPGAPGCKAVEIHPHPGPLTHARGKATMNDQLVSVAWRIIDGEMTLSIECEGETPVRIVWPDGVLEEVGTIQSGEFRKRV
jgi:hypothetical protein